MFGKCNFFNLGQVDFDFSWLFRGYNVPFIILFLHRSLYRTPMRYNDKEKLDVTFRFSIL